MRYFKFFLGLEVARSSKGILLSQWHYALQLFSDVRYPRCSTKKTTMDPNMKLSQDVGDLLKDPLVYRRMIGKLLSLTITQPNLSALINCLSQFLAKHCVPHLQVAHQIFLYVKGTVNQGLLFSSSSSMELKAFANAD